MQTTSHIPVIAEIMNAPNFKRLNHFIIIVLGIETGVKNTFSQK
jgi:hypothetical protein